MLSTLKLCFEFYSHGLLENQKSIEENRAIYPPPILENMLNWQNGWKESVSDFKNKIEMFERIIRIINETDLKNTNIYSEIDQNIDYSPLKQEVLIISRKVFELSQGNIKPKLESYSSFTNKLKYLIDNKVPLEQIRHLIDDPNDIPNLEQLFK
jgi:hypothetical protein